VVVIPPIVIAADPQCWFYRSEGDAVAAGFRVAPKHSTAPGNASGGPTTGSRSWPVTVTAAASCARFSATGSAAWTRFGGRSPTGTCRCCCAAQSDIRVSRDTDSRHHADQRRLNTLTHKLISCRFVAQPRKSIPAAYCPAPNVNFAAPQRHKRAGGRQNRRRPRATARTSPPIPAR
jgi:hypothetical protein